MTKTKEQYEQVWNELVEYKVIDENTLFSENDLINQIMKNMEKRKFSSALVEHMIDTDGYKNSIDRNITFKITKGEKEEKIEDGYTLVIPKGKKVQYNRKGRQVTYYKSNSRKWNHEELRFLMANRNLATKTLIYKYNASFTPRTSGSISTKAYRVKKMG